MNDKTGLMDKLQENLIDIIPNKDLFDRVMAIITVTLADYEIKANCTSLITEESSNEIILKRYGACLLIDGKSEKTIYQYLRELKRFYQTIGKTFISVTVDDIRLYLAICKTNGMSNRTLANIRSYLFSFFKWLSDEELIDKNPCAKINPIKYNRAIKPPFADVEIDAIRSACKTTRERAIVELLLSSGVRREELCDLKINDLDFTEKSVLVRHGKGNKRRITYMSDLAATYIKRYLNERGYKNQDEPLFTTQRGNISHGGLMYILNKLSERSGVTNIHPHRFRRTFATSLANRGMDIQDVQQLLGHTDINTTMQYVCIDNNRVKNSYKRYSQNIY